MTHSGQGNEPQLPAVPTAYEGVVLPAHGDPWVPEQQASPAAGQPWGQPWGPEPAQALADTPAPEQQEPAAQPLPLPAEEAQFLPPQAAGSAPPPPGDADATQLIPPIPGGSSPLPPEVPDQSTQFLGRRPLPAPGAGPDAEATQLIGAPIPAQAPQQPPVQPPAPPTRAPFGIRPGLPGDRQPPAEFDNLFRSEGPADAPDATQQMPRFAEPPQPPPAPHQPQHHEPYEPQGRAARRSAERGRGLSTVALIGIVIAGCSVVGLAAGAALSSGGDDKPKASDKSSDSSLATKSDDSGSGAATDPAEKQAKSLDVLLEDSNNSRSTVIKAVGNIKTCTNLGQAAQDLRAAAGQRNSLVARLQKLSVDELPDHQALTSSLTRAWKASAGADNHYAAWAEQVAAGNGKKNCPKGTARTTGQTAAANRASGQATQAKQEAAKLWNGIAGKYGLKQRQFIQL
ncbi:hypothetical protein ABZW18_21390 [Streptomyces sp. NPDC004647]|uniref:hypothetical protein n=1 Tax=Streptomyces sp. NPDC004647 TaxID=3154671 RepID=UPI0033BD9C16